MRKESGWWLAAGLGLYTLALGVYGWGLYAALTGLASRPVVVNLKVLPDGSRQPELFIVPEK